MKKPKLQIARYLSYGVGSWLSFESSCDRSGLFNEKYLAGPVGQVLNGRCQNRPVSEWPHSALSILKIGAGGKRLGVDFVVLYNSGNTEIAVETKWAGRSVLTTEKILWDLIRLEKIVTSEKNARCFFLLGGQQNRLNATFNRKDFADQSKRGPIRMVLRWNSTGQHETRLYPPVASRKKVVEKLLSPYQNIPFPRKILSRRAVLLPEVSSLNAYRVYVWEILKPKTRKTFLANQIISTADAS